LLAAYHTSFAHLYFDTGFIYDVFCYCFYFTTLLVYLRRRQANRFPGWGTTAACCVLYICALDSKEMALTLPVFLLAYECLHHPPRALGDLVRWLRDEGRGTLTLGAVTLIFLAGRALGPGSLIAQAAYRPKIRPAQFMLTSRVFLQELFLQRVHFTSVRILVLWSVLLAIAWASCSRTLRFAWLFLMLAPIPVAFILPRGAPQYYVALFGWALYGAAALEGARGWLARRTHFNVPGAAVFGAVMLMLYPFYKAGGWSNVTSVAIEGETMRRAAGQLQELRPCLRPKARLYFFNDPVEPQWDNLVYLVHLSYRDRTLVVDRFKRAGHRPDDHELATYDAVFDYKGGRFIELERPWQARPTPMIVLAERGPEVYHVDWSPVTPQHPAHPNQMLIAKAIDLGPTAPDPGPDEPFPADPLARVIAPVSVRVDGRETEVINQIGWPHMVNTYRVDFRMPPCAARGTVAVDLVARGAGGPPVRIPVH
jgi:hypothetical protein